MRYIKRKIKRTCEIFYQFNRIPTITDLDSYIWRKNWDQISLLFKIK